jgi:hypothetical protein
VNEVHTGTYADFKDFPLGQGNQTFTDLPYGLRIPQHGHKMGIDPIFVE